MSLKKVYLWIFIIGMAGLLMPPFHIVGQSQEHPAITAQNIRGLALIHRLVFDEDITVLQVIPHSDTQHIYITYWQGEKTYIALWDITTLEEIAKYEIDGTTTNSIGLGGNNQEIVVIPGRQVTFLAHDTLTEIKSLSIGGSSPIALSDDEHHIITGFSMGFGLIDVDTESYEKNRSFPEYAYGISWNNDFSLVASSYLSYFEIWDVANETQLYQRNTERFQGYITFHPTQNWLVIDNGPTLELFDLTTQQTLSTTTTNATLFASVGINPAGTLLTASDSDGIIHLYDISLGTFVKVGELLSSTDTIRINALTDNLMFTTQVFMHEVWIWGLRGGTETGLVELENSVLGTTTESIMAQSFTNTQRQCAIQSGEIVLAIGKAEDGSVLVYSSGSGCEGLNWIPPSTRSNDYRVTWEQSLAPLREFVHVQPPLNQMTIPINDAIDICTNANGTASLPNHEPPYITYLYGMTGVGTILDLFVPYGPTRDTPVELILCSTYNDVIYETCYYSNNTTFTRIRRDITVMLVDYQTHGLVASQTFRGNEPEYCASTQTLIDARGGNYEILGQPLDDSTTWVPWALDIITNGIGGNRRTVVNSESVNIRSEPNTTADILTRLSYNTPLNVMGKNEVGDWLAVLLPDMSKGWVSASLIQLADSIDITTLPVLEPMPADQLPILLP